MPRSTQQMIEALRAQRKVFDLELVALQNEQKGVRTDLSQLGQELAAAWDHLLSILVPSLEPEPLNRTSARIQLRDVEYARVAHRMNAERAQLLKALSVVAGQPLYRDREAKRNEAAIRIHEVEDALEPLEHSVRVLESEPFFLEVFHSGYGTEGYGQKFWQLSYYRHWKHADLILEHHGKRLGTEDFAALRAKYASEKAAIAPLTATRAEWTRLVQDLDDLERKHLSLSGELESLERRTLVWVRGRVREHLSALHENELHRMLAGDEELRVALARILGVEAKRRYLEELLQNVLKPPLEDLRAALEKTNRDIQKLGRPKNYGRTWPDADYQRRFGKDRTASWNKRRARIREARTRIVQFNDYDRWSPTRDFLWWDVMTDGQLDGNFIEEVRGRGPRHRDDQDAAAVASASARDDLAADVS